MYQWAIKYLISVIFQMLESSYLIHIKLKIYYFQLRCRFLVKMFIDITANIY